MPGNRRRSQVPGSRRSPVAFMTRRALPSIPEYPNDFSTSPWKVPERVKQQPVPGAFLDPRPVPIRPGLAVRQVPDSSDLQRKAAEPSDSGESESTYSYGSDGPFDRLRKEVTRSAKGLLPAWGKRTPDTGPGALPKSPLHRRKEERNVLRKPPRGQPR